MPVIHHFPNGETVEVADADEKEFERLLLMSGDEEAINWAKKRMENQRGEK